MPGLPCLCSGPADDKENGGKGKAPAAAPGEGDADEEEEGAECASPVLPCAPAATC